MAPQFKTLRAMSSSMLPGLAYCILQLWYITCLIANRLSADYLSRRACCTQREIKLTESLAKSSTDSNVHFHEAVHKRLRGRPLAVIGASAVEGRYY